MSSLSYLTEDNLDIKTLVEEIKDRDQVIASLRRVITDLGTELARQHLATNGPLPMTISMPSDDLPGGLKHTIYPDDEVPDAVIGKVLGRTVAAVIDEAGEIERDAEGRAIYRAVYVFSCGLKDQNTSKHTDASKMVTVKTLNIARICHAANRAFCASLGDHSQLPWDQAPEWQRESIINGVEFRMANPHALADAQHNAWMNDKLKDGWVYGEVKDPIAKTHPCLVPYRKLPVNQRIKDTLFIGIVDALRHCNYGQRFDGSTIFVPSETE